MTATIVRRWTRAALVLAMPVAGAACASAPGSMSMPPAGGQVSVPADSRTTIPRTLALRGEALASARLRLQNGDQLLRPAYDRLLDDARKALESPLVSVTDKSTLLPPSGSRHDYFSLSPYWWPDPAKPDGLPYVRRDGETNPDSKRDLDQPRVARLGSTLQTLALAYYFTGDEKYAARAAQQLRHWFLDPATAMTPHLRFAQLVRGNPRERGSGIIDTRWFIESVDAARLLEGSASWTAADDAALRRWFTTYRDWLVASPNGIDESDAPNNHGSWYAAQVVAYSLYAGDSAAARTWLATIPSRITAQITPKGDQPFESARTRSLHYHYFNLEALGRLAEMGRHVGVDLWSPNTEHGARFRQGMRYLAPFIIEPATWPEQQIDHIALEELSVLLWRGHTVYGDPLYASLVARLPEELAHRDRFSLLYPDAVPVR